MRADTVWINAVGLVDPAASPVFVEDAWPARPASAHPSAKACDAVARGVAAGKAGAWSRTAAQDRTVALQSLADATCDMEAVAERIAVMTALADRSGGRVVATRSRHLVLLLDQPFRLVGLVCRPDLPLLGLVALLMPALAAGNGILLVPPRLPGLAPTDLAALLGLGALPAGTVTLLDGEPDALAAALADHPEVAAVWSSDEPRTAADALRRAARVKVLWVPYGA